MKRISGLSPPYSVYAVTTVVVYVLTSGIHYFLLGYLAGDLVRPVIVGLSVVHSLVIAPVWWKLISGNPEALGIETSIFYFCGVAIKRETRYCPECRKMVFEIDHHCAFLNNCVNSKNYGLFFTLIATALSQMVLFCITSVLFQSNKENLHSLQGRLLDETWFAWVLVEFHLLLSAGQCCMLMALVAFHLFLAFWAQLGTYDWLLRSRTQRRIRRNRGHGYSASEDGSERSHVTEILAAKLRQKEREEFESSLFAGKRDLESSFRSNASSIIFNGLTRMFSYQQWDTDSELHHSGRGSSRKTSGRIVDEHSPRKNSYSGRISQRSRRLSSTGVPLSPGPAAAVTMLADGSCATLAGSDVPSDPQLDRRPSLMEVLESGVLDSSLFPPPSYANSTSPGSPASSGSPPHDDESDEAVVMRKHMKKPVDLRKQLLKMGSNSRIVPIELAFSASVDDHDRPTLSLDIVESGSSAPL